tara:strand:+ start:13288 stop:13446 length:159 start_codon:yes stop_codon:yes gene_type:complete
MLFLDKVIDATNNCNFKRQLILIANRVCEVDHVVSYDIVIGECKSAKFFMSV